jgi:hypothetical protein
VSAYFHGDADRFLQTELFRQSPQSNAQAPEVKDFMTMHLGLTFYTLNEGHGTHVVVLLNTQSAKLMDKLKEKLAAVSDTVTISYQKQDVCYTPSGLRGIFGNSVNGLIGAPAGNHSNPAEKAEPKRTTVSIGLGEGPGDAPDARPLSGAIYTAFVGDGLAVAAEDLPTMALALDVIAGRKPSLAQDDPHHLRVDAPPGVFLVGAGLQAMLSGDSTAATQPAVVSKPDAGGFKFDLFGSFQGKAQLARCDFGENDQAVYFDAACQMSDSASAEQLKNLILGLKALAALSQTKHVEVLIPLDVHAADKAVQLHWEWPVAKLPEFYRLMDDSDGAHDHAMPATNPAPAP